MVGWMPVRVIVLMSLLPLFSSALCWPYAYLLCRIKPCVGSTLIINLFLRLSISIFYTREMKEKPSTITQTYALDKFHSCNNMYTTQNKFTGEDHINFTHV